jgi:hypothetical protein
LTSSLVVFQVGNILLVRLVHREARWGLLTAVTVAIINLVLPFLIKRATLWAEVRPTTDPG